MQQQEHQRRAHLSRLNRHGCVFLAIVGLLTGRCGLRAQREDSAPESVRDRSCSISELMPQSHQALRDEDLMAAYTAQAALVESLEATVIARGKGGAEFKARSGDSRPSPVMIAFRAPASLRMTGEIPFSGQRSFDLASDGREFWLLVPDGKLMRLFAGPVDAPATSANPRENLRPQPVIDALRWPAGTLQRKSEQNRAHSLGARTITLNLMSSPPRDAKTAVVEFDLDRGVVAQLTLNDAAGHAMTTIQYNNWQASPSNRSGIASTCFPRRIVVLQPGQDLQLEMKVVSLELNVPIALSKFRLMPPRGVQVTRLSSPEPAKNR